MMENALNTTPDWYRGDLHAHTTFSDGALTPNELIALASVQGLDFLAITDHNTLAAFQEPLPLNDVLVVPGAEVTLDRGHFNVFGTARHESWMEGLFAWPQPLREAELNGTVGQLVAEISRAGHLVSVNHPLLEPWAWRIGSLPVAALDCLEVWNDPSWPDNRQANPAALDMWTRWLNDGHRITAIGGSDYHRPRPPEGVLKPAERLGYPATFIYAQRLSFQGLMDGLRARRTFVSLGPRLGLEASLRGKPFSIGADLGPVQGELEVAGRVSAWKGGTTARLLRNGVPVREIGSAGEEFQVHYREELDPANPVWFRLDVHDGQGEVLAFTNPIFAGPRSIPTKTRFGDFL